MSYGLQLTDQSHSEISQEKSTLNTLDKPDISRFI